MASLILPGKGVRRSSLLSWFTWSVGETVFFLFLYRPTCCGFFFFSLSVISIWAMQTPKHFPSDLLNQSGKKEWWCILTNSQIWSTIGVGFGISWCDHLPLVVNGSLLWVPLFSTESLQEVGGIALCCCVAWHENGNRSFFLLLNGSKVE